MKRIRSAVVLSVLFLLISGSSCDKNNEWGPGLSGTWSCEEESQQYNFRRYKVSIERDGSDTTLYRIYNFYNLGLGVDVMFRLRDTVLTILPISSDYNVVGTGKVNRTFTDIFWEYSISGMNVNDQYVNARYYRR